MALVKSKESRIIARNLVIKHTALDLQQLLFSVSVFN